MISVVKCCQPFTQPKQISRVIDVDDTKQYRELTVHVDETGEVLHQEELPV